MHERSKTRKVPLELPTWVPYAGVNSIKAGPVTYHVQPAVQPVKFVQPTELKWNLDVALEERRRTELRIVEPREPDPIVLVTATKADKCEDSCPSVSVPMADLGPLLDCSSRNNHSA